MFGGVLQPDVAVDVRPPPGGVATALQGAAAASPAALTHVDGEGKLRMVDVGSKPHTRVRVVALAQRACAPHPWLQRTASASARVLLGREAFQQVAENRLKKARVPARRGCSQRCAGCLALAP